MTRERLLMDFDWRFFLGDVAMPVPRNHEETYTFCKTGCGQGAAHPKFDDSAWRRVDLPHDWSVEGRFDPANNVDHGYLPTGVGWYRKAFILPPGDEGRLLSLQFDGAFRNSTVWLNGHRLGVEPSGYSPFGFDISDVANFGGPNVLAVRVDAGEFEGWWYEGAGIYRHVWLVKTDALAVSPCGVFVRAETVQVGPPNSAELCIQTRVRNAADEAAEFELESQVLDGQGKPLAAAKSRQKLAGCGEVELVQRLRLDNARLWSLEDPCLYRLRSVLRKGGQAVDEVETPFGVRTIRFDAERGFLLNGQSVKLKGVCNHQDHAGVGVAVPDRIQEYRIERLKSMGCNALRTAHNPPAAELLDACDRLGLLVMDETRKMEATPEGLSQLERMILRDRNHPSIVIWSLGNEEPVQAGEVGGRIIRKMKNVVRRLDPTRPVTAAMNGHWGSAMSTMLDVQGCNYQPNGYDDFKKKFPDKPMVASETSAAFSTRGIYVNDADKGYSSAYDSNAPGWGNSAEAAWKAVADRPFVAGTFVWTGFDYRGEPQPYSWPCINSHFGILDTCGLPKDSYYYYQAWWGGQTMLHLLPHWNWPDRLGQEINVWCHGNCQEVELLLNGKSQGRQAMPVNGHLEWKVKYAPGALEARGYRDGKQVASAESVTTGAAERLVLTPHRAALNADGQDVSIVTVSAVDAQGRPVPVADNEVSFSVSDNARILGVGNGDPSSHEPDKASRRRLFNGLAMALIQARRQAGAIVLKAISPGLRGAEVSIDARPCQPRPMVPPADAG